ncbi:MAG: hypothetical protein ABJP45_07105 [Cyclobacteriaceae bacterium]
MRIRNIALSLLLLSGCSSKENSSDARRVADDTPTFQASFDYKPETPRNGKLLGIIELGYSGFNSFIVRMDNQDRWSLEKVTYDESYVGDGSITFDYVLSEIQKFRSEMIEYGVSNHDINFVASSSAIRNQKVVDITEQLRSLNIGIITVSATQEGIYAFDATIPKELKEDAFMVDMGSGNTKVSWMEGSEVKTLETFGSRYHEIGTSDQDARIGIKDAVAQVPSRNRNLCFMVGKIPFLLATKTNNRSTRYTVLESPSAYSFTDEQSQAGLNLYDALWEESTISYVFDWDSNYSIGVLMNVN